LQEDVWPTVLDVGSCQEIGTDHFQAITAGPIATEHQRRGFNRLLDHWSLALVELEVDNLRWFRLLSSQFLLYCLLELLKTNAGAGLLRYISYYDII
jgi:hypothetical protein